MKINEYVDMCYQISVEKGFWEQPRETGTLIALIHSEVTEALDAVTVTNFCEELADICIRIGILCGGQEISLEKVLNTIASDKMYGIKLDFTSFEALERSFEEILPEYDDYKNACRVHGALSYALESDRNGDYDTYIKNIGVAFLETIRWAAVKGYKILPALIKKKETSRYRPKLHGKKY